MDCDLKIGIGELIPHMGAGFGGGGKLVFPGVMSIESVAYNHGKIRSKNPSDTTGMLGSLARSRLLQRRRPGRHRHTDLDRFGPPDQVIGCASWADVLEHLEAEYPENARVAVFPCAAIQCPETGRPG
jgi:hypothetical protein